MPEEAARRTISVRGEDLALVLALEVLVDAPDEGVAAGVLAGDGVVEEVLDESPDGAVPDDAGALDPRLSFL